jgi:hypothetical protein
MGLGAVLVARFLYSFSIGSNPIPVEPIVAESPIVCISLKKRGALPSNRSTSDE